MTRRYTDDDMQGVDPRVAFRLGKIEVYQEMSEEFRKEAEILDMERKQKELELEVLRKRLGIG